MNIEIRKSDYAPEIHLVRVQIPGMDFKKLLAKADALEGYRRYYGDVECENMIFEPTDMGPWFDIEEDVLVVHGWWTREGDDALDGTLPPPTEMSLSDRLEIAALIKKIIAE